MPASDLISTDLPCITCNYNLRTLSHTATCPECATLVANSLRRANAPFNPKRARIGAFAVALALFSYFYYESVVRWIADICAAPNLYNVFTSWILPPITTFIPAAIGIYFLSAAVPRSTASRKWFHICLALVGLLAATRIIGGTIFAATAVYAFSMSYPPFPIDDFIQLLFWFTDALEILLTLIACNFIFTLWPQVRHRWAFQMICIVLAFLSLCGELNVLLSTTGTFVHLFMGADIEWHTNILNPATCRALSHLSYNIAAPFESIWRAGQMPIWIALAVAFCFQRQPVCPESTTNS